MLADDELQIATQTWPDEIERHLLTQDRWLFVVYDDLDVLSPDDWEAAHDGIGELVRFWATTSRRFERLQPKLFLRADLYRRIAVGPDVGAPGDVVRTVTENAATLRFDPASGFEEE